VVKLNVTSVDAKKLKSFCEFAEVCFSKKMDRGVEWLEGAMSDQTSSISFAVPDVHSEKSYRELRKV
jgi:hypothetical protein